MRICIANIFFNFFEKRCHKIAPIRDIDSEGVNKATQDLFA